MNFLNQLIEKLADEDVGKPGVDLFKNSMPYSVSLGIALMGKLNGDMINYELPGYRKTGFQLVVRALDFDEGEELIQTAMNALTFENQQIGNIKFNYVRPRHDPVSFPTSDGNNTEFSVNFDACFVIV